MNKTTKIILNIILSIALIASLFWGYVTLSINCWYESECTLVQSGYWPLVFMAFLPAVLVIALVFINRKK
jgi:hypothetical protein